jgi:uncharacterized protein
MVLGAARALMFIALGVSLSAQAFPKPTGRVNDFANVIDSATEAEIDSKLDLLEQKTSSEIAVVTIKSLGDMSVEEYANKLFKEWGIGQAKQDNGVLVLVAPNDRKMRVEVGYGLEGVLPDGLAGQVIRDQFTPKFKSNDYSGGIKDGVDRLVQIVEKHQVLTPEELAKFNQSNSSNSGITVSAVLVMIPFFGLFVAIGFGMMGIGVRTKTLFPLLFGSAFGILPLLMSLLFLRMTGLFTLGPLAIVAAWFGHRMGGTQSVKEAFRNSATSSGRGWTMGTTDSSSSSDSGSSSSSSSSSDFGGGSSGGGGASGSW